MSRYTISVEQDEQTGDLVLPLPQELLDEVGWDTDDVLEWKYNDDGSFSLTKKEDRSDIVLVETISTFRVRYAARVPKGKKDWALDSVTMEEVQEFSQKHLDETIVSHRLLTNEQYLELFDEDNDYLSHIHKEKKFEYITDIR